MAGRPPARQATRFADSLPPREPDGTRVCDVPDCCTRHHRRKRLPELVADVKGHVQLNRPWQYQLSDLHDEPAVTAAVENIAAEEHAKAAA